MHMWKLTLILGLLVGVAADCWAQATAVELKFPEGRKARYKHKFRVEYYSNLGEQIVMQSGSIRVIIDNEWRSHEEVVVPQALPGKEIPEGGDGYSRRDSKGCGCGDFFG